MFYFVKWCGCECYSLKSQGVCTAVRVGVFTCSTEKTICVWINVENVRRSYRTKKKKKIQLSCWDLNHALNRFSTIPLNLCFTLQANLPDSPYFSLWLMFVLSALRNCFVTTNLVDSDADVFQTYALMLQKSKQRLLKRDRKKQQPNWFYGLKTYITREDEN